MVDQLNERCNIQGTQQLKRRIIEQLQAFFHANNAVVNMFKTALERMPSDTHKFVKMLIVPQQVNMCEDSMRPPLMMLLQLLLAGNFRQTLPVIPRGRLQMN